MLGKMDDGGLAAFDAFTRRERNRTGHGHQFGMRPGKLTLMVADCSALFESDLLVAGKGLVPDFRKNTPTWAPTKLPNVLLSVLSVGNLRVFRRPEP